MKVQFVNDDPENGTLGTIVIDGPAAGVGAKPGAARLVCSVWAPHVRDSIVRRHEANGEILREITLDVGEGLDMVGEVNSYTPLLVWRYREWPEVAVKAIHAEGVAMWRA